MLLAGFVLEFSGAMMSHYREEESKINLKEVIP
jgi:hypothetical protein